LEQYSVVLDGFDFTLVERLGVPATVHDTSGRIVYMNAASERASGFRRKDMVGQSYLKTVPQEAKAFVEAHFRRAAEQGEPTEFETPYVDGDGILRGVRAQQLPIRENGEIVGVLVIAFDVRPGLKPVNVSSAPHLTERQREVLELLASGLTTSEIARELTLSTETVRNHIRSIFRELGAHTRPEALATADRLGLLAPPAFSNGD
jgi:PAS domain S-box-containing protein